MDMVEHATQVLHAIGTEHLPRLPRSAKQEHVTEPTRDILKRRERAIEENNAEQYKQLTKEYRKT